MTVTLTTPTGAQVLHQGHAVLPAEVHKLHVLYLSVEVHTFALCIVAALSRVQQRHEVVGDDLGRVLETVYPNGACGKLQEGGGGVRPLPDELEHQGVVAQAELPQVRETHQALGEGLETVLVKLQGDEAGEVSEFLGQGTDDIVVEAQEFEGLKLAQVRGYRVQLVTS